MDYLNLKDNKNFMKNYIKPMIKQGLIEMTEPDVPTSNNKKYVAKNRRCNLEIVQK